jgi:hypothetical protein
MIRIMYCLFSFLLVSTIQAKEQMVILHISGEDPTGSQTVMTIGNSALFRFPCNDCDRRPEVVTNVVQQNWQKWLPVPKESILFTVYRSEEVDQLVSKLESNIAKLSDLNDSLTTRIDALAKQVEALRTKQ